MSGVSRPRWGLATTQSRHFTTRRRGEGGQVVPLIALTMVVMAGVALVIVSLGGVLSDRAAARTAADAAALTAAAGTDDEATTMAEANGATVVAIHRNGHQVEVEVRLGRATARARAEAVPPP